MAHSHDQAHDYDLAFKVGIAVNGLYVIIEAGCGFAFNSVALISDAGHNLSDVLALVMAWAASFLSRTRPTERRTYGMRRATVLASLASAVLLCLALGAIIWESTARLTAPTATSGRTIVVVAGIGVIINLVTAFMFMSGRHGDLNIKSAFLHMASDAAVSLGVVVAGVVILATGWLWVDPIIALAVSAVILVSGLGLLRESLDLAMDAVPDHVDVCRRAALPRVAARRPQRASPAHLGHEHDRNGADRASGHAARRRRRRAPAIRVGHVEVDVPDSAPDDPGRVRPLPRGLRVRSRGGRYR